MAEFSDYNHGVRKSLASSPLPVPLVMLPPLQRHLGSCLRDVIPQGTACGSYSATSASLRFKPDRKKRQTHPGDFQSRRTHWSLSDLRNQNLHFNKIPW